MNASVLPELPPELAAKAAEVPGLADRLLLFIRQEVVLHERRQGRYSAQARELLRQAKDRAAEMKAAGVTREQGREDFLKLYNRIIDQISSRECSGPS